MEFILNATIYMLPRLRYLNLKDNVLVNLPASIPDTLDQLWLSGNNWKCDCSAKPFRDFILQSLRWFRGRLKCLGKVMSPIHLSQYTITSHVPAHSAFWDLICGTLAVNIFGTVKLKNIKSATYSFFYAGHYNSYPYVRSSIHDFYYLKNIFFVKRS